MSMRIERSSLDQVRKRFEQNKKKIDERRKEYDFEERIKELKEEVGSYLDIIRTIIVIWRVVKPWISHIFSHN